MPEDQNPQPEQTDSAQQAANAPEANAKPKTLDDMLSDLPDEARQAVLGEVSKARTEAKNLRSRLKEAEPKLAEYDQQIAAQKTDAQKAQEALAQAQQEAKDARVRAARSEIKAVLSGVSEAAAGLVDDLDVTKYLGEDGNVDADALGALKERMSSFGKPRTPRPDPTQGSGANGQAATSPAEVFASFINGAVNKQG